MLHILLYSSTYIPNNNHGHEIDHRCAHEHLIYVENKMHGCPTRLVIMIYIIIYFLRFKLQVILVFSESEDILISTNPFFIRRRKVKETQTTPDPHTSEAFAGLR